MLPVIFISVLIGGVITFFILKGVEFFKIMGDVISDKDNKARVPQIEPEFVVINDGKYWFVLKLDTERNGVYVLRDALDRLHWKFKKNLNYGENLVYNAFGSPNLYGFESAEKAVTKIEEVCGEELRSVNKNEKFLSEFGKHIYLERESRPEPKIEGEIHDLDEFMEAQFGDEDLSDIKLGAGGSFNEKKI